MATAPSACPTMLSLFFFALLMISSVLGAPALSPAHARSLSLVPRLNICNMPLISSFICKNDEVQLVTTPMGLARGIQTTTTAVRFSVKYATAARFQPPVMASSWTLPRNLPSGTPPPCPQVNMDPSVYSEDCLYMNIFAPASAHVGSNLPILVWIHGGSYYVGSSSDPGLDGSQFAANTNSIVITIQYRLGALGYLPPTAFNTNKNLGVQDVIMALKYINKVAASFGGDKTKVTVAGQSSGANMVRNLLAAPSAASYFSRAILHSDPINYGFLSTSSFTTLQSSLYSQLSCGDCVSTPVGDIITAQANLFGTAWMIDPAAGFSQPIRPVLDGSILTSSLTTTFPSTLKPMLLTTLKDDALPATYTLFTDPVPDVAFQGALTFTLGPSRAASVSNVPQFYSYSGSSDVRDVFSVVGTDEIWKCAGWTLARNWASRGGTVYTGQFTKGATYPGNERFAGCTSGGGVCHQDDIYILFGTTPNASAQQTSLTTEVQSRWSAFMRGNAPNAGNGTPNWNPVSSSGAINALNLGGSSPIPDGACDPSFWGSEVPFDYQMYNQ